MKIVQYERFQEQLNSIDDFIRQKSEKAADDFLNALYDEIQTLDNFPYKFRKSIYYDDETIRDCIFRGYVIPYKVLDKLGIIAVLAIFRENIFIP